MSPSLKKCRYCVCLSNLWQRDSARLQVTLQAPVTQRRWTRFQRDFHGFSITNHPFGASTYGNSGGPIQTETCHCIIAATLVHLGTEPLVTASILLHTLLKFFTAGRKTIYVCIQKESQTYAFNHMFFFTMAFLSHDQTQSKTIQRKCYLYLFVTEKQVLR